MAVCVREEERNIVSHMDVTILPMKLHELLEYHFTRKLHMTQGKIYTIIVELVGIRKDIRSP
jgi:hypothetical protein